MSAEISNEDWFRVKGTVESLDHCVFGNGQPGLEEKLVRYIDTKVAHKQRGNDQVMADLKKEQDVRHEQNTQKMDGMSRLIYIGLGIVITLQFTAIMLVAFLKKG